VSKRKLAGIIVACIAVIVAAILLIHFKPWEGIPPAETYALTTVVSPSGAGYVSPSGGEYEPGDQVTITASPASGYTFDHWSGSASANITTITITMDSDKSVTANFETAPINAISVQTAWTTGWPENWDADAANDGLRIWVELLDSNESRIEYTGMSMPLQIELYSTESVTYPLEKSRLIYSGSGTLTDWDHDCFCTGAVGVKDIPWQDISSPLPSEDQDIGILYITVTLPNGKDYTDEYYPIQIRNK
jgi:uncharacterized repeat protein (TIGR02543 family)